MSKRRTVLKAVPPEPQLPEVDIAEAHRFLQLLGRGEDFTFQTFDEQKLSGQADRTLARVLHGNLASQEGRLRELHEKGAGIFVMVNRGDGKGREAANVVGVRANYIDLDGAPLEPVVSWDAHPNIIVASSPGKWHAYWLVQDEQLEDFTPTQQALAERFRSDGKVTDLPRVMRLPGFLHRKAAPFLTHVIYPVKP